jgi:hypothetical protein
MLYASAESFFRFELCYLDSFFATFLRALSPGCNFANLKLVGRRAFSIA